MSDCHKARNDYLKVQQLQRTLYRKSKQEEKVKFYSLYDKLYRKDVLSQAWQQVKLNKSAPGIDGRTIEEIVLKGEEDSMLERIGSALQEKTYQRCEAWRRQPSRVDAGSRRIFCATQ